MKIYTNIIEIEKDFFPALYQERLRKRNEQETPEETGQRLAREVFDRLERINNENILP